jgi:hypothetical protein
MSYPQGPQLTPAPAKLRFQAPQTGVSLKPPGGTRLSTGGFLLHASLTLAPTFDLARP